MQTVCYLSIKSWLHPCVMQKRVCIALLYFIFILLQIVLLHRVTFFFFSFLIYFSLSLFLSAVVASTLSPMLLWLSQSYLLCIHYTNFHNIVKIEISSLSTTIVQNMDFDQQFRMSCLIICKARSTQNALKWNWPPLECLLEIYTHLSELSYVSYCTFHCTRSASVFNLQNELTGFVSLKNKHTRNQKKKPHSFILFSWAVVPARYTHAHAHTHSRFVASFE